MKRMQAIVSGSKKKQCTKISKPEISDPIGSEGNTDTSGQPAGRSMGQDTSGVVKPGPRSPPPGTRRAAASLETSPSMPRKGSASKIPASSPKKEASTKRPASPPKGRSRQNLEQNSKPSKQSSKALGLQQRLSKKPSTKDKRRKSESDTAPTSPSNGKSAAADKRLERSSSTASKSSKGSNANGTAEIGVDRTEGSGGANTGPQSTASMAPMPHSQSESSRAITNEPRSRQPVSSTAAALPPISPPGGSSEKANLGVDTHDARENRSAEALAKPLPPPPLHGILKESRQTKSSQSKDEPARQQGQPVHSRDIYTQQLLQTQGSSKSNQAYTDPRAFQNRGDSQGPTRYHTNGENRHNDQPSRTPSRSSSFQGSTDGVYSQVNFNSLPAKPDHANSAPNAYSNNHGYNSLPRRTRPDNVPGVNLDSNHNNNFNSWGFLDRRVESDSGFGANGLDRSFSSTSSSNYANYPPQHPSSSSASHRQNRPLNYAASDGSNYALISSGSSSSRGMPRAAYTTASQAYQPPRPDSVPPLGSNNNLNSSSSDVFYDPTRPVSVPPQHPNNVHAYKSEMGARMERYGPPPVHRGHRAGSVPLGYESEPAAYGYARGQRSDYYDSDSGHYQRHQYPSSGTKGPRGLRVHPEDERYRAAPGKKPIPRRHTVGTPNRAGGFDSLGRRDPVSAQCYLEINYL